MALSSASNREIWLRLDVRSEHHQTACVFEKSSLRGPEPQFQSFTIWCGSLQWERGASPSDYLNSIYGTERSRVSFIHDFGGCGVYVEIFDRTVEGCSTVIDQLDKTYLPIVVEVLRVVKETRCRWYSHGGTLLADYSGMVLAGYIRSAMAQNRAGQMREDLFAPFHRYEVERGVGLSEVALIHNYSLQYRFMLMEEDPMTGLARDHLQADVQLDRYSGLGLSDESIITGHGGGGLVLQRGAGMYQSTNPFTNPELYHSPEDNIQRGDGGNSQDGAPVEGASVHKTHRMKCFDSLVTAGKDIYSSLASLGVSPDDLESQGADIPVLERIYHLLSEHDQTFQHWLRDAGTVGASFSAVYASPSLTTQLPAAVAFFTILTAMWLPRKRTRTKSVLTKFAALASIASVMSAMVKYLSPVGMAIVGPLFLIPAAVVLLA